MERKIKSLQDHVSFLYEELELKETEIDDLKSLLIEPVIFAENNLHQILLTKEKLLN